MDAEPTKAVRDFVQRVLGMPDRRARSRALRAHLGRALPGIAAAFARRALAVTRSDPHAALDAVTLGLMVADHQSDLAGRVACLRARACAHTTLGRFAEALRTLDSAVENRRRLSRDPLQTAELEALRVQALLYVERHAEARETGRRVLAIFEEHGHREGQLRVHFALADLAYRVEHPREALRHYHAAEAVMPPDAPPALHAMLANNRGNALESCQRFRAAGRQFALARAVFADQGGTHAVAQIDYNAAYRDHLRGRYDLAISKYAHVEQSFLDLRDERMLGHVNLDRAEIHIALNLPVDARHFAAAAETRFRDLALDKEAAQAAYLVGRAREMIGEREHAAASFRRAEAAFARLGLDERRVGCLVQRAHMEALEGRYDEARRLARRARDALTNTMSPLTEASVSLLLTRLDTAQGSPGAAEARARRVIQQSRHLHAPWVLVEAYRHLGRAQARQGKTKAALLSYEAAVEDLERYRGGVPHDEYMSAFLAGHAGLYAELVDLLLLMGDGELAFEYSERARSRALVDLIAAPPPHAGSELPPFSARRVRYLRERLNAVYRRLFPTPSSSRWPAARDTLEAHAGAQECEMEIARLLRSERAARIPSATPGTARTASRHAVASSLPAGTTLLEYFLADDWLVIFVITRDGVHVHRVAPRGLRGGQRIEQTGKDACRRADVRRHLARFFFHLSKFQRPRPPPERSVMPATRANLRKLSDLLIQPVRHHLRGDSLVIVPHGPLHRLPFHALPWDDGWVVDRFRVSYAPSASVYARCAERVPAPRAPIAVFGLPDPRAPRIEEEARRVAARFPGAGLYLGRRATLERLREQAPRVRLLHLATHGMFRHAAPMLSAFRLADGWVSLYDLYELSVSGALVVLSACESGVADVTESDELLGLARGFLRAGARALLTSQWRVDDAVTARYMDTFYGHWSESGDTALASREAMLSVRKHHPHPYFWAPFFLTGRSTQVPISRRPSPQGGGQPFRDPRHEGVLPVPSERTWRTAT